MMIKVCPKCLRRYKEDTKIQYSCFHCGTRLIPLKEWAYRNNPISPFYKRTQSEPNSLKRMSFNKDKKTKKRRCLKCGAPVWNNSNFCWDCYKEEKQS